MYVSNGPLYILYYMFQLICADLEWDHDPKHSYFAGKDVGLLDVKLPGPHETFLCMHMPIWLSMFINYIPCWSFSSSVHIFFSLLSKSIFFWTFLNQEYDDILGAHLD